MIFVAFVTFVSVRVGAKSEERAANSERLVKCVRK